MLPPDVLKNADTVFRYLFGLINKYEFRAILGKEAKHVWSQVVDNGYALVNCKLYLYARHVAKVKSMGVVKRSKFEVSAQDAKALGRVNLAGLSTKFKPYSLDSFRRLEASILMAPSLQVYIGKFISRKLIFLVKSYSQKRDEIEASLKIAGMYALRKQYPAYASELHALNICKTAIANSGHGMIEYWTRDKRNALLKENGRFQAVHVSYDALHHLSVNPEHDSELRINVAAISKFADRCSPKNRDWVMAAAGVHSLGFSLFLGQDNRDLVETTSYANYLGLLSQYLGVSQQLMLKQLRAFLT